MVEGARLESVFRGNSNVGSNPTLSAIAWSRRSLFARRDSLLEHELSFERYCFRRHKLTHSSITNRSRDSLSSSGDAAICIDNSAEPWDSEYSAALR